MSAKDAKLVFSNAQAETTQAAHASTNIVDLGAQVDHWGSAVSPNVDVGGDLRLHVQVVEALTTSAGGTLTVELQDSDNGTDFASVTPGKVITAAEAAATLVAGYTVIDQPLPSGLRRYLRLLYTIGTGAMTAGAVDAWIGQ